MKKLKPLKVTKKIDDVTKQALSKESAQEKDKNIKILKERAKKLAKPLPKEIDVEEIEIIEFSMAFEIYGIESSFIREIYPLNEIVHLPFTPPFVLGITNVRGQILSVINLKTLFELPKRGISDMNKIIIMSHKNMEYGLLADSIIGMKKIEMSKIQKELSTLSGIREKYLLGISDNKTIILDTMKLLTDKELIINNRFETKV